MAGAILRGRRAILTAGVVVFSVGAACATDSTAGNDPTYLDYYNVTARTDLRVRVVVGRKTLGTYSLPADGTKRLTAHYSGGTVVTTTVLDAAGATVAAGSCTILADPYNSATVVVDPAVNCGCGFDDGSGGEGVPCNPGG